MAHNIRDHVAVAVRVSSDLSCHRRRCRNHTTAPVGRNTSNNMSTSIRFIMVALVAAATVSSTVGQCLSRLSSLELLESSATDLEIVRQYKLCPETEYNPGKFDINGKLIAGDQPPIVVRSNLNLKCGSDGNVEDNCNIVGGEFQLDASNIHGLEMPFENVVLEGITFKDADKYSVYANRPGNITFINCAFVFNTNLHGAVVLLDYENYLNKTSNLTMNFVECTFSSNKFKGSPGQTSMVTANGPQNVLTIKNSFFDNNDFVHNNTISDKQSYLIESSGPLTLIENCFQDNLVGVSSVVTYAPDHFVSLNNYGITDGPKCAYASTFSSSDQFYAFAPGCVSWEANVCLADATLQPSPAPSEVASLLPTKYSTQTPTVSTSPSMVPSDIASDPPTGYPTVTPVPTNRPSVSPPKPDGLSFLASNARGAFVCSIPMVLVTVTLVAAFL